MTAPRRLSHSPPLSDSTIDLSWPVRARWGLVLAYVVAVFLSGMNAVQAMDAVPLLAGAAATVLTNLALPLVRKCLAIQGLTVLILLLDVAILTAVLFATGGATNPLTALYIMPVALAAVMLPPRFAWTLTGLTMCMFFLLFASPESQSHHKRHPELHAEHHGHSHQTDDLVPVSRPDAKLATSHSTAFDLHLRGMWMAFCLAAALTAYFVTRVSHALREREQQLDEARLRAHRAERVASLGSLAASTAHELGTPLGSIALAASEMKGAISRGTPSKNLAFDAEIICSEVKRCREIIDAMIGAAGETVGETPAKTQVLDVVNSALSGLRLETRNRISVVIPQKLNPIHVPPRLVTQALLNLINNALEASTSLPGRSDQVSVVVTANAASTRFDIRDTGPGMTKKQVQEAMDPFVSTKEGRGRGMGLFFANSVAVRLGGELTLESTPEQGTTASLVLPQNAE